MAGITHAKASGLPADEGDPTQVEPTDWYAEHIIYAMPTIVGVGSSATGTGNITPTLHASHQLNDIHLLFVQSGNQAVSAPAGGWAQLGPYAGIGVAAAALATRGTVFWLRDNGSSTDPTVTDAGDHTLAQILTIRGCPTTGNPFLCIGARRKTTASVTGTASAGATPVDNCLVVNAFFHGLDSASAVFSSFTNADLGSVTEQIDVATADGNGGGIGVCTGTKAVSGDFAATTVTETSTTDTSLTFIMLPAGVIGRAGFIDQQIFLTPGSADTWSKPTGARSVVITAVGGGAGGSAGRNAATAAGGGGGGGGGWGEAVSTAGELPATLTVTAGSGGAATANTDGAASNAGTSSTASDGSRATVSARGGFAATASASGAGGAGGGGGGESGSGAPAAAAATNVWGSQPPPGGTGGTTGAAGSNQNDFGGGGGGGGGTTQAGTNGGNSRRGGGGGGGGRSNTNFSTGGGSFGASVAGGGGQTVGASGGDSPYPSLGGGGGAASGNSATGPGGSGGWPGGGGGGGGSQSGAQRGGAGGDGVVVITTYCG